MSEMWQGHNFRTLAKVEVLSGNLPISRSQMRPAEEEEDQTVTRSTLLRVMVRKIEP